MGRGQAGPGRLLLKKPDTDLVLLGALAARVGAA